MDKTIFTAALLSMMFSHPCFSQECTDLARVIGRESNKVGDSTQISILNTANLCTSKYESASNDQKAQIEASYGIFSGGASGSSQQIHDLQESRCENHYGNYWYDRVQSKEIERVSQAGADVIRACINQQSFRLVGLTIQDEAITASFRYGGSGDTIVNGIIVSPKEIAQCRVLYNGKSVIDTDSVPGTVLKSGDTLALDCRRTGEPVSDGQKVTPIGVLQTHYKGGIIGIATVADVSQVPLIAYNVPNVSQTAEENLSSQITSLRSALQVQQSRKNVDVSQVSSAGGSWGGGGNDAVDSNARCPSGQVVIGVNMHLGGTCNNNCDPDGRPVSSFSLVCGKSSLQ